MDHTPSTRAEAITRRTYNRTKDEAGDVLETWDETVHRATAVQHKQLWEGAGGTPDQAELDELEQLVLYRKALVSGRTLWLGGTDYATGRACSQFNCTFNRAQSVYQFVDAFWLLLNGCGVGFKPQVGTLHGFLRPIDELEIIPSTRDPDYRGREKNAEELATESNDYHWTINVGDSAEAWAKSLGKLINPPLGLVKKLTIDFSELRGSGKRLKGYGWICNGSEPLIVAYRRIFKILNAKAGDLLDEIDLLDVMNHMGTVLSSRRAAEGGMLDYGHPRWEQFATAKREWWLNGNNHRQQSNNSLVFWHKPSKSELRDLMMLIWESGGSEPGFVNGEAARRRAPWFEGLNPCGEILEPPNGVCNLVTTAIPKFFDDFAGALRTVHIMGRANYRQTCVDLRDGILSPEWHQTNEALRLCGSSMTGIAQSPWLTDYQIKRLRDAAVTGCYSMADELGLPRPKLVTCIKPEGTGSKIMDVTEGIHRPLGKYVLSWINFSSVDPIIEMMERSGYRTMPNPNDSNGTLVGFPVEYPGAIFKLIGGKHVNTDTAITQLNTYRRWNTLWSDHNTSITVSWDISELDDIVDWLDRYWDDYVAVSWFKRNDPTKSAADLGYKYLPQEVVTQGQHAEYLKQLKPVDWSRLHGVHDVDAGECASGACPVK
jgi:ribonucleoside-triphosphate reductase